MFQRGGYALNTVLEKLAELAIVVRPDGAIEQRVACPQCGKGERDDALGVNIETGVFHCFRCAWSGRAGDRPASSARVTRAGERPAPRPSSREGFAGDGKLAAIWARTQPLRGSL